MAGRVHELKIRPEFFAPILSGEKRFELRKDDRGFHAGDTLRLREWTSEGGYSGREASADVSYLVSGEPWLQRNMVCMSIENLEFEGC
jgi:hypothetical protein